MNGFVYDGKTALVTGASSGIGKAFARELAGRGTDVVLVARSEEKLQALAEDLRREYGVRSEVVVADLSEEGVGAEIRDEVERRGLTVDILVNNAGFATHGLFEELDPARDRKQVAVDVAAVADMAHAFLPGMVSRGDGAVVNLASVASFQPTPYMAVYGASKAFVLSFSVALAEEYRGRGVRVVALAPGATETAFHDVAGAEEALVGRMRAPEQAVATALRALERGRSIAVDGRSNTLQAHVQRLLPQTLAARIAGRVIHPQRDQAPEPVGTTAG